MILICDDREGKVHPHLEAHTENKGKIPLNYEIKRMTVGDYAITHNDQILIIIERKTWSDLAASCLLYTSPSPRES